MLNVAGRKSYIAGIVFAILLLPGAVANVQAQSDWRTEWEKTLAAAKKEGRVVIHAGPGQEAFFAEFDKKYSEIKAVYIPGRGGQRIQRVMAERRAGQYLADIVLGGGGPIRHVFHEQGKVLAPIKPILLLPEVLDQSKWWRGRQIYLDKEGSHIVAFAGITQSYFQYNPGLVNPNEFKSYWDFLDPKWKGKIVIAEPLRPGTDGVLRFLYHNPEIGPKFLKRLLGQMDVTATRNTQQYLDWLARGKYPIAALWSADRSRIVEAKQKGLPVAWFDSRNFKEGAPLSTTSGNIAMFDRAPHPNAARVLINWLLSREGQIAFQKKRQGRDSLRIDIPKDDVREDVRRRKGVKYSVLVDPKYMDIDPIRKLVKEVWRRKR